MIKVLFITNLPAPYKIEFLNELGKLVELTVIFERSTASNRNKRWFIDFQADKHFDAIWLSGINIGDENSLDLSIISCLRKKDYDLVLVNGYSSFSEMIAISYLKFHRRCYAVICDGIIPGKTSVIKKCVKKWLISGARFWLSPNEITDAALKKNGAIHEKIYRYPFSSIHGKELVSVPYDREPYKEKVGCDSKYMILFVGQMIYRKGIDVLCEAVGALNCDYQLFLVGDATDIGADNDKIVNIGFLTKNELKNYYMAADVCVLPSREDIWGLVINEALSLGTPVIATDKCGAALELIENSQNGFVVPADRADLLGDAIASVLNNGKQDRYMEKAIETAKGYTIESMADTVYTAVRMNE